MINMHQIDIDDKSIKISVKPTKHNAKKTVRMEFKAKDELLVYLPHNTDVDIDALLKKHHDLIERKYREYDSRIQILEDKTILYKGNPYEIEIRGTEDQNQEKIELTNGSLIIYVSDKQNPLRLLKKWLREQTKKLVQNVREKYSENLDEEPTRLSVTDTSRWGYCRKNRAIILNWQLSTLPPELSEYVVLHELVHLSHMNHQKDFHKKLMKLIPDYKRKEKELKKYLAIEQDFEFRKL